MSDFFLTDQIKRSLRVAPLDTKKEIAQEGIPSWESPPVAVIASLGHRTSAPQVGAFQESVANDVQRTVAAVVAIQFTKTNL